MLILPIDDMTQHEFDSAPRPAILWQDKAAQSKFCRLLRATCLCLSVGLVLAFLSGCTSHYLRQTFDTIAEKKSESLRGWEAVTIGGNPLMESLGPRVAMLMGNFDAVSIEIDGPELAIQGKGTGVGNIGSAVPISIDGYFLTAAHNIPDGANLHMVLGLSTTNARTRAEGIPARLVWKSSIPSKLDGDSSSAEPTPVLDFAIVHAEPDSLPPIAPFPLAGELPQEGEPVIIAGWPILHFKQFPDGARLAAGRILSVHSQDAKGSSPAFLTLHHDTPFVIGDSGGPLIDRQGNLLGINTDLTFRTSYWQRFALSLGHKPSKLEDFRYFATSTMPDPNWLEEVIEQDRLRRKADREASTHPSPAIAIRSAS